METIDTIKFRDADSGDEAVVIVRAGPGMVALAATLRSDGDTEVHLGLPELDAVLDALRKARSTLVA